MKNLYKMTIAATLAVTMGVVSAYEVPGLSSTFSSNIDTSGYTLTPGADAITNVNAILEAVGATDGTDIDKDAFWNSFIQSEAKKIFDYSAAKPLIAQLVFNVLDETQSVNDGSWADNDTSVSSFESNTAGIVAGTTHKGDLAVKGEAAVTLLTTIGFTKVSQATLGAYDPAATTVELTFDPTAAAELTAPSAEIAKTNLLAVSATIGDLVDAARINADAFNNANDLITQIASKMTNAITLDVISATAAVDAIIAQHNSFLGASVVVEAKKLKDVIKNIGYQIAAAKLGQTAGKEGICMVGNVSQYSDIACTTVGEKFQDISTKISGLANITDFTTALNKLEGFADNIIAFNLGGDVTVTDGIVTTTLTVPAAKDYDSTATAQLISDEFGQIIVLGGELRGDTLLWADDTANAFDLEGFDGELFVDLDGDSSTDATSAGDLH